MKKRRAFVWVWCFPQMALGALLCKIIKAEKADGYYIWKSINGLSLGEYIFAPKGAGEKFLKHERGHTIQSYILGWFYLLVIGLPSIIWAGCFGEYRRKNGVSYYSFYTERWADKLGGVDR